ncbi:MAG: GWxTD domain-containing protein [Melioribacteraceae bacterium]|nr:GWxTD domain-containing protein [Melioribacteraceae bacterium]
MRTLLIFIFTANLYLAQPFGNAFHSEINSFYEDSVFTVVLSYKISYDKLIFLKNNSYYESGLEYSIEVYKDERVILRDSDIKRVSTENYNDTNSPDKFLNGLINFTLPVGEFKFISEIALHNSDRTIRLTDKEIKLQFEDTLKLLKPICIIEPVDRNTDKKLLLTNNSGLISYSANSHSVVIPVVNYPYNSAEFALIQNDSILLKSSALFLGSGAPEIKLSDHEVQLQFKNNLTEKTKYFLISEVSQFLDEGEVLFRLRFNENQYEVSAKVVWLDKPRVLYDPQYAIELLNYIESADFVESMLSADEDNYYNDLKKYWGKYDREKSTAFIEIMNEFYSRADTADAEFGIAQSVRGSDTDRGMIFIKYGRPDSVERTYNETNETVEIWTYIKFNKKFVFEDKTGLGNFTLLNHK